MDQEARGGDAPEPPIEEELSVIISRQDLSWQKGNPLSIEYLFGTLQSKSADGRELLDLICNEVYLRQLNGEAPKLEDYQQRFPAYATAIAIQWQVDGLLEDVVGSDDSTSRAAIENEESVDQNEVTKIEAIGDTLQPTPPLHDVPPELLKHPNYRFKRQIGRGGMGTVWLAEQLSMQRMVAIKLIRSDLASKPESVARFRRELLAVSRLRHPNIVTAYDAGHCGNSHFLVFEYIQGLTLAKLIEYKVLSICEACTAVRDVALGLGHAHAVGLVHRDIKPANIIRDVDGLVKVLDFGLVVEPDDESSITGENIVMGTPDYISPEQADDPRLADARSDIYSLGCTLYHLLSGRAPFKGLSQLKKLDAQRYITADPVPNVPQGLQDILSKMMAKRPEERFQTASEVVAAITPFCTLQLADGDRQLSDSEYPASSPKVQARSQFIANGNVSQRRSRRAVVVAGVGVCGSLLMLNWPSCNGPSELEPEREKPEPDKPEPEKPAQPDRVIQLTKPSSFADGGQPDIEVSGDGLIINAMNRSQVWLNYQQVKSASMQIVAGFRFLQSRDPEPIVKFVFQSCQERFHEYSAQFRLRQSNVALVLSTPNEAEKILGTAKIDLKLNQLKEMRFRIDESGLSLAVDSLPVLDVPCQRTKYYACVAALYCSVELSDAKAEDVE